MTELQNLDGSNQNTLEYYRVSYMYADEIGVTDVGLLRHIHTPLGLKGLQTLSDQVAKELAMNNSQLFNILSWQYLGQMTSAEFSDGF